MKKLILFLVILFTDYSLQSQSMQSKEGDFLVDNIVLYSDKNWKHNFYYDKYGNRIKDLLQVMEDSIWVNHTLIEYSFDSKNNLISETNEFWDENKWVNLKRDVLTYDEKNNRLTSTFESWYQNSWISENRINYKYDKNNFLIEKYNEDFDTKWVGKNRFTYTYNPNGNKLTELYEIWIAGKPENNKRSTYNYDSLNRIISEINEEFLEEKWYNQFKTNFTYDTLGNQKVKLKYKWADTSWIYLTRYTGTFDKNHNMLTYFYESFSGGVWVKNSLYTYSYNSKNKILTRLYQDYDNGMFVNVDRQFYTYNSDGNLIDAKNQINKAWSWVDGYGTMIFEDPMGLAANSYDGFKIEIKWKIYSSIEDFENNNLSIFPNPASDFILVSHTGFDPVSKTPFFKGSKEVSLEIYNVFGESVSTTPPIGHPFELEGENIKIDISNLHPGVYFIKFGDKFEKFVKI